MAELPGVSRTYVNGWILSDHKHFCGGRFLQFFDTVEISILNHPEQ
jgi:hypothetical protein